MLNKTVLLSLVGLLIGAAPSRAQSGFVVVVNAENPTASMSAQQVSRFFQRKVTSWSHGQLVEPVDLPESSPVRQQFTEAVHRKSVSAVEAFWQKQIFSGRAVPPVRRSSDAEVLSFVSQKVGAIGYVSSAASAAPGVKVVTITGGGS